MVIHLHHRAEAEVRIEGDGVFIGRLNLEGEGVGFLEELGEREVHHRRAMPVAAVLFSDADSVDHIGVRRPELGVEYPDGEAAALIDEDLSPLLEQHQGDAVTASREV